MLRISLLLLGICVLALGSHGALAGCEAMLPAVGQRPALPNRSLIPADLLSLRDIGQPDGAVFGEPSPLGLSPDGRRAAFILNRADPTTNRYCRALVIIDLEGPANPRILDTGGELITNSVTIRGLQIDGGFPAIVTPVWSPDGKWVAWLRREKGITQLWRARTDGGGGGVVSYASSDVRDFAWSRDGAHILFTTQPDLEAVRQKIAGEGMAGWLYDERFVPSYGLQPQLPGDLPAKLVAIDLMNGRVRPATDAEQMLFGERLRSRDLAAPSSISVRGQRAWTERPKDHLFAPLQLLVDGSEGKPVPCAAATCRGGFTGLWWNGEGTELRFLRREGWANGELGFYRWRPGRGEPERLWRTTHILHGCVGARSGLLCTSENSVTPRHLILIDPETGLMAPIFDPNPEFRSIRLGKVERLRWKNDYGLEAWGDLVLPPGHNRGKRLPLIVVQYTSLGFLRGGTGDEYPIQALAAQGFAVLSLQQPDFVARTVPGVRTVGDLLLANNRDWAQRRSLLSSLQTGIDKVVTAGVADPARIGLTGLSDGATTVRFALINSDRFAAASVSSCCLDPSTVSTYTGPAFASQMRSAGFPAHGEDAPEFWQPFSLARNAGRIDRPMLMQLADSEALIALESFTALQAAGQPVEMFVFPDERHIKWQPAHRRAIYERNIDWFRFWLQGYIDPDPVKAGQYRRWNAMRERRNP